MLCSARAVANYFLRLASQEGKRLTHMQIQKLVYFAHGWNLGITGKPLILETVEAWEYGPVIADLYHELKRFGNQPIYWGADAPPAIPGIADCEDPEAVRCLLNKIWEVYGEFSGLQLSTMTHEPGTPWAVTREKYPDRRGVDIDDDLIRTFFEQQAVTSAD